MCSDVCQSIPINTETIFETKIDYCNQQIKPNKSTNKINNSSQKPKSKFFLNFKFII